MKKYLNYLFVLLIGILFVPNILLAEGETIINEVDLSYDTSIVAPDTMWTIDEFHYAIQNYVSNNTTGLNMYRNSNSQAYYYLTDHWTPAVFADNVHLDSTYDYAMKMGFRRASNYDLPEDVKAANDYVLVTSFENFKVKVNEVDRTDVYVRFNPNYDGGFLGIIIPMGKPTVDSYTPYLEKFEAVSENVTLGLNDTKQFSVNMKGLVTSSIEVNWSLTGNNSSNTTLSTTGLLTIGADETADAITVTGSNNINSQTAVTTVTISQEPLVINSISLTANRTELYPTESTDIYTTVNGTADNKTFSISLSDNNSTKTKLEERTYGHYLTIGADETASSIKITAISNYDNTKTATITIKIKKQDVIKTIDLVYKEEDYPFWESTSSTDFIEWVRKNTTSSTEGIEIYDNSNTNLYKLNSAGKLSSVGETTLGLIDEYYIMYGITIEGTSSKFPNSITVLNFSDYKPISELSDFKIKVNGVEIKDALIGYSEPWNCVMAYVPIGKAKELIMKNVKPSLSIEANNNSLKLSWTSQIDPEKVSIYRSTDNKKWIKLKEVDTDTYKDKSLTYGKTYYYKIKAYKEGSWSKYSSVIKKKIVPNKVKLSIKSAGSNNIKLTWEKVSVTGYEIYSSTDNKKWTKIKTITSNSTLEYNNKKLKPNKTYYYKARAYKTVKGKKYYGKYSSVVSTKTTVLKPELSLIMKNAGELSTKIGEVKGATNYIIEFSTDGTTYSEVYKIFSAGSNDFGSVNIGDKYYFRAKACTNEKCSGYTYKEIIASAKTPGLSLETSKKKVTVTVKTVEGVTGYEIYRATKKNGKYTKVKTLLTADSVYKFKDSTKKGTTYYYKVRAYIMVGDKKVKTEFSSIKKIVSK